MGSGPATGRVSTDVYGWLLYRVIQAFGFMDGFMSTVYLVHRA